jgi:hypothetical protein
MAKAFSPLEKNILKAKGVTDALLKKLLKAGIKGKDDFKTVGDAGTLAELVPGLSKESAAKVLAWASGTEAPSAKGGKVVVDSADVVYCVHCGAKQPKDYKSGDLCGACGKEAEPVLACFWCSATGPGQFCRQCGAEFVPAAELDLAQLLKREGIAKDDVPKRLKAMSADEKKTLWGRIRKSRG